MFNNIGEKIKGLAKILCWGGIIFSLIFGWVLIFNKIQMLGLLLMIFGPVCSWISSFFMYGFGELITETKNISKHTKFLKPYKTLKQKYTDNKNRIKEFISIEELSNRKTIEIECPTCETNLVYTKGELLQEDNPMCEECYRWICGDKVEDTEKDKVEKDKNFDLG